MTTSQVHGDNMRSLNKDLSLKDSFMKEHGLTIYDYYCLTTCVKELQVSGVAKTFNAKIIQVFITYGFNTFNEGTNFTIK